MLNEIRSIINLLDKLNNDFGKKVYSAKEAQELDEIPLDLKNESNEIGVILKKIVSMDSKDNALLNERLHYLRLSVMNSIAVMEELEEFLRRIIVFTIDESLTTDLN